MRVVVTGGAGFIGANLCNFLGRRPEVSSVVALDDLSSGREANLDPGASTELVRGSVLDPCLLDAVVERADSIVHLAARPSVPRSLEDPIGSHEVNVNGTLAVLEAARRCGVPHVVVASSSSVYGDSEALPKHEELPTRPKSPYAASKAAAEALCLAWSASYGIDVLVLRFFNVFGPLQPAGHAYAAVVPTFVRAALGGDPLPVEGDGYQTRDFTFVGLVVSLLSRAVVERVSHPGPVNLAGGSRTSLLGLIAALEAVMGRSLARRHLPPRPGDVRHSQADTARLAGLFGPLKPPSLEEALKRTVEWWRTQLA